MLALFRTLPLLTRLATVAGLVLAIGGSVWGVYAYVRHQGYVDGYTVARQQCEDEKQKQETANQNAMNAAAKRLTEALKLLAIKEVQLDDYLKALDLAADQEPGGGDACLDPDSVRRLSAIQ
jgi:hypothetical protein